MCVPSHCLVCISPMQMMLFIHLIHFRMPTAAGYVLHLYMYVCLCMYTHAHAHTRTHTHTHAHTYTRTHTHTHDSYLTPFWPCTHTHTPAHTRTRTRTHTHTHTHTHTWLLCDTFLVFLTRLSHIYVHVCVHICIHTCVNTCTCIYTHLIRLSHIYEHACVHMCVYMHVCVYIHLWLDYPIFVQCFSVPYVHVCVHMQTYVCTCIYMCIYTPLTWLSDICRYHMYAHDADICVYMHICVYTHLWLDYPIFVECFPVPSLPYAYVICLRCRNTCNVCMYIHMYMYI